MTVALEPLAAWLADRSAALPPLPAELLAAVEQRSLEWWDTAPLDPLRSDPTEAALAAGESGTLDHFLLVARTGYGFASYFFHVVFALGPLVVVARLAAPTAFDDELAGPRLGRVLDAVGPLAEAADAAVANGVLAGGERLVVLDDDRSGSYRYGTARHGVTDWQDVSPARLFEFAAAALSSP